MNKRQSQAIKPIESIFNTNIVTGFTLGGGVAMAPGGYLFRDFRKVGLPLTLVLGIVILVILPFIWPL